MTGFCRTSVVASQGLKGGGVPPQSQIVIKKIQNRVTTMTEKPKMPIPERRKGLTKN